MAWRRSVTDRGSTARRPGPRLDLVTRLASDRCWLASPQDQTGAPSPCDPAGQAVDEAQAAVQRLAAAQLGLAEVAAAVQVVLQGRVGGAQPVGRGARLGDEERGMARWIALSHSVGELRRTSSPSRQTCQPSAHRSAAEQPMPAAASPVLPAARAQRRLGAVGAAHAGHRPGARSSRRCVSRRPGRRTLRGCRRRSRPGRRPLEGPSGGSEAAGGGGCGRAAAGRSARRRPPASTAGAGGSVGRRAPAPRSTPASK